MSSRESDKTPTYPGGIQAVLKQMEGRRDALGFAKDEALAGLDTDLHALTELIVPNPEKQPEFERPFRSDHHRKTFEVRRELYGSSELCALHGLTIAHLRKRSFPDHAPALFQKIWAEEYDHLLKHLDARWLVSAITTFGDHGVNAIQRSTGLALSTLFGTMKLYENERLYSGKTPDKPFALKDKVRASLPLEMDPYSITSGGLDVNMLGRLWQEACQDPVVAPLAQHLIDLLIHDDRTVFRRLMTMRKRKKRQEERPAGTHEEEAPNSVVVPDNPRALDVRTLRWGIVATIKAPLTDIARFVAHHLELGAHEIWIYLDQPDAAVADYFAPFSQVKIIQCDDAYWKATGKNRMEQHQLRQAFNATRTLREAAGSIDWLAHIDVDEFLLPDSDIVSALATASPKTAFLRIPAIEALADDAGTPTAFKRTHLAAGVAKAKLEDIYPTFGMHLWGGFLSHVSGKVFARTGIEDARFGIHTLKYQGTEITDNQDLTSVAVAHFHAPSWEHFKQHLEFRQTKGSYRRKTDDPDKILLGDILDLLIEEDGEDGLRALFDEVALDTPDLRQRLSEHGMLVEHDFDLDGAVRRVFGDLP